MINPRILVILALAALGGGLPVSNGSGGWQSGPPSAAVTRPASGALELVQYVADSTAFHVNSVVIMGPTEAILIDTQYHLADARHVADGIAASGRRLKAIFITHPDHDHFSGAAAIVERFPGTPVFMTEAAIRHFDSVGVRSFRHDQSRQPTLFADSVVHPRLLPSTRLTVDGETVEIIPDLQGDILKPLNSVVWIPSSRTLVAGDLVFSGVHVWLGDSDAATRSVWRSALHRLAEMQPAVVIAGHKATVDTPDRPAVLQTMIDYLADFDEMRQVSQDGPALASAMREKYPWTVAGLLNYSARVAFRDP